MGDPSLRFWGGCSFRYSEVKGPYFPSFSPPPRLTHGVRKGQFLKVTHATLGQEHSTLFCNGGLRVASPHPFLFPLPSGCTKPARRTGPSGSGGSGGLLPLTPFSFLFDDFRWDCSSVGGGISFFGLPPFSLFCSVSLVAVRKRLSQAGSQESALFFAKSSVQASPFFFFPYR